MSIQLKIHTGLIEKGIEAAIINVVGDTVGECLKDACRKRNDLRLDLIYDGDHLMGDVLVYVNGDDVYPEELDAKVREGDKLELIPIIGGG